MKGAYRTMRKQGKINEQEVASFLPNNGQGLLHTVDLMEHRQVACNELLDVTGRRHSVCIQLSAKEPPEVR